MESGEENYITIDWSELLILLAVIVVAAAILSALIYRVRRKRGRRLY